MEIRNQGVFLKEKAEEGLRSRQRWMGEDRRSGLGESTKEERKSAGPEAACSFDSSRPKRSSPFSLSLFLISLLLFFSTSFYLLLSLSLLLYFSILLYSSPSPSLSIHLSFHLSLSSQERPHSFSIYRRTKISSCTTHVKLIRLRLNTHRHAISSLIGKDVLFYQLNRDYYKDTARLNNLIQKYYSPR